VKPFLKGFFFTAGCAATPSGTPVHKHVLDHHLPKPEHDTCVAPSIRRQTIGDALRGYRCIDEMISGRPLSQPIWRSIISPTGSGETVHVTCPRTYAGTVRRSMARRIDRLAPGAMPGCCPLAPPARRNVITVQIQGGDDVVFGWTQQYLLQERISDGIL
jgi:hypothetical protein